MSFAEIGRQVGLSLPAAADRVRRLEDAGFITGYSANINLKKLGYPTTVFIQLTTAPTSYKTILKQIENIPEVIEAHHVSGDLSFLLKLRIAQLEDLEPILEKINRQGSTKSIIALSTVFDNDGVGLLKLGE